jgi:hypothetical protein
MMTKTFDFTVLPIAEALAQLVRQSLKDPIYGLPVHVTPANGYGPCRVCLRTFATGEPRILFLYNAFSAEQEADFAGPVYIHAQRCRPYAGGEGFPQEVAQLPIAFFAYDSDGRRVAEAQPDGDGIEGALAGLFALPEIRFVHVRNAEAKCFIARVERSASTEPLRSKVRQSAP